MENIDPDKCIYQCKGRCFIILRHCNPHHPECEYEDERKLGIPDDLWEEK